MNKKEYKMPDGRRVVFWYDEDQLGKISLEAMDMLMSMVAEKWVPCSERLPDYGVPVLTWDGYCYCVEKRIPCVRDENGEPIFNDWWVSDDYDETESDCYPNLRDGACIAWMPLPEPYNGDKE